MDQKELTQRRMHSSETLERTSNSSNRNFTHRLFKIQVPITRKRFDILSFRFFTRARVLQLIKGRFDTMLVMVQHYRQREHLRKFLFEALRLFMWPTVPCKKKFVACRGSLNSVLSGVCFQPGELCSDVFYQVPGVLLVLSQVPTLCSNGLVGSVKQYQGPMT